VIEGNTLAFTNAASDPDSDALTFSLDPGAPANASINPTNGIFSWTPTEAQGPATNSITVRVTDNGVPNLSATQTFQVVVLETNVAPVLSSIASRTVHAGSTVLFTNVATDSDLPPNALTFSLDPGAPGAASVDSITGIFSWTTTEADANSTNNITVRVTDNGVPPASDAKAFVVNVVSRPLILSIGISNNAARLTWTAVAGQKYRLQYKTDFVDTNWSSAAPDSTASGSTAAQSDSSILQTQRFYRVLVLP
jgi:hypothetical protein